MGDQCKTILGPLVIKAPGYKGADPTLVDLKGSFSSDEMEVRRDLSVKGRIRSEGVVRVPRLVARTVKAPFLEGALVNRFINKGRVPLFQGDVVVLTMSTLMCPGNTGEVTIFLQTSPLGAECRARLAGVVIGNEEMGAAGFDEVFPESVGFVCIGGICPSVRVDSQAYCIEEGACLTAGPDLMAIPESAVQFKGKRPPRLGITLCNVEDEDGYAPVLIQPAYARL